MSRLGLAWRAVRRWLAWLNGDAAYQAYCRAWVAGHPQCDHPPPTRAEFFRTEQERRWSGVRRCC